MKKIILSISLILGVFTSSSMATEITCLELNSDDNGANDFDFFSGKTWSVKGRKRVGRFIGSETWETMEGIETSRRIGNIGMLESLKFPKWRPGKQIQIVRLYDTNTKQWAIYDANNPMSISPPVVGSFSNGLGIFIGDDLIDDQPVKVRFTWTCDFIHPRYQQEFSNDDGKSWEVDWQMTFTLHEE